MNGLDIVILVTFFGSTLIGALRGFTKELLSLFSWGGAVTLSYIFLPIARGFVQPYIANPMMGDLAAIFCLFIISLILLSIIANILAGYIHESSFRGVDHSLGFGFGILRGVIFISSLELLLSTFWPRHTQSPTIQTARFTPMVRKGGDTILQILPSAARGWILDQAIKVENQLNAKIKEGLKSEAGAFGETPKDTIPKDGLSSQEPLAGQPPQGSSPGLPLTIHGHPQGMMHSQGQQVPPQMVVIRPPQPGQVPQLATAPQGASPPMDPGNQGATTSPLPTGSNVRGIGQPVRPQDTQTTVDELARLKPRATEREDSGYTRGQRDDMNRLFQAADGE